MQITITIGYPFFHRLESPLIPSLMWRLKMLGDGLGRGVARAAVQKSNIALRYQVIDLGLKIDIRTQ